MFESRCLYLVSWWLGVLQLLLLDFREVKEVYFLPQSINKLGCLFVPLLCERLAHIIVHLPHHIAEVTGIGKLCQYFTELGDVPRAMDDSFDR